jgi:YVTN family beta-propeller protein
MSCPHKSDADITFAISGLSFMNEHGEWIDVAVERSIDSRDLAERQIKLSEFYLPAGKYERIKWTISEAKVRRGAKTISLTLPEPSGEHVLDIEFTVFIRESLALFVDWNAQESILDKDLFKPSMAVRKQGIEITSVSLYVTNSGSNSVTVIDKQLDRVVATIAVGQRPMGIVTGPRGARVYVANSGSNSISVIDTAASSVINTISNFGYSPAELAISGDGRLLYATNPDSDNVTVIDTMSNAVVERIPVGRRPAGIAIDEARGKVYVANSKSNSVSILNKTTFEVEGTVTVGLDPRGVAIQEDELYVANWGSNNISVIGMPSHSVTKTIPMAQRPLWVQSGLSGRIYVSNANNNEVSFLSASMGMVTRNVSVGDFPSHMAVDTLRRKLYVVNGLSEDISVINLAPRKVRTVIQVGKKPHGIALIEE